MEGLQLHRTTEPGDATRVAARTVSEQVDVVIAVDGDGTVREVVQGLLQMAPEVRPALLVEVDALVLLGACSGLIAEALVTALSVPQTGRERYRIALARTAERFEPYPGRVIVDGIVVHSGPTVLANVGGGQHRGGAYQVLPHSILDDGLLDVFVIGYEVAPVNVPELTRTGAHASHLPQ